MAKSNSKTILVNFFKSNNSIQITYQELEEATGIKKRTAQRVIDSLVSEGTLIREFTENQRGRQMANKYTYVGNDTLPVDTLPKNEVVTPLFKSFKTKEKHIFKTKEKHNKTREDNKGYTPQPSQIFIWKTESWKKLVQHLNELGIQSKQIVKAIVRHYPETVDFSIITKAVKKYAAVAQRTQVKNEFALFTYVMGQVARHMENLKALMFRQVEAAKKQAAAVKTKTLETIPFVPTKSQRAPRKPVIPIVTPEPAAEEVSEAELMEMIRFAEAMQADIQASVNISV